jgi:hypothetical protein
VDIVCCDDEWLQCSVVVVQNNNERNQTLLVIIETQRETQSFFKNEKHSHHLLTSKYCTVIRARAGFLRSFGCDTFTTSQHSSFACIILLTTNYYYSIHRILPAQTCFLRNKYMIKHSIIIMILLPKRIFVERLTLYRMDIAPGKELPHFKDYNISMFPILFECLGKQQIC